MKKSHFLLFALLLFAGAVHAQSGRTYITLEKTLPSSGFYDLVWDSIADPRAFISGGDIIGDFIYVGFNDADFHHYVRDFEYKYGRIKIAVTTENNDTLYINKDVNSNSPEVYLNYIGMSDGEYMLNIFYYGLWWKGTFVYKSHWPEGQFVYVDSTYYRINNGYANTVWPEYYGDGKRTVTHRMLYELFERDYPIHVVIPSELSYEGETYQVVGIGQRSFKGCYYMQSISLPNTITYIDGGAFMACKNLRQFVIPQSVTSIEGSAFAECVRLSDIVIPEGIETLADNMFKECTNLSAVTLPGSLTSIEEWAFALCTSLPYIDIPDNVASIGEAAFQACENLMEIKLPKKLARI